MHRLRSTRTSAAERSKYDYVPLSDPPPPPPPPLSQRNRFVVPLLAVYSILVTVALVLSRTSAVGHGTVTYAPRQAPLLADFTTSLRFKKSTPAKDAWHDKLYSGDPSPEVERAWHRLLNKAKRGYGVKITTTEADELGFTDYETLPDGRVLSAPAVYHDLHCLRRIRQLLYADHYYPDASPEQLKDNRHHTSHCLETIRASMVCNPDLSLLRVTHVKGDKEPFKAAPAPVQKCVDWDSLVHIVDQRAT